MASFSVAGLHNGFPKADARDVAATSGDPGTSAELDDAVGRFAMAYAEQNRRDHQALVKAIDAGRIRALRE